MSWRDFQVSSSDDYGDKGDLVIMPPSLNHLCHPNEIRNAATAIDAYHVLEKLRTENWTDELALSLVERFPDDVELWVQVMSPWIGNAASSQNFDENTICDCWNLIEVAWESKRQSNAGTPTAEGCTVEQLKESDHEKTSH